MIDWVTIAAAAGAALAGFVAAWVGKPRDRAPKTPRTERAPAGLRHELLLVNDRGTPVVRDRSGEGWVPVATREDFQHLEAKIDRLTRRIDTILNHDHPLGRTQDFGSPAG